MNVRNGRLGSGPGILKISTGKLDAVQMAEAWLLRVNEIKHLKIECALVSKTNAAQHMNINTIAGNGASKMLVRHGVACARNAQEQVVGHIITAKDLRCSAHANLTAEWAGQCQNL